MSLGRRVLAEWIGTFWLVFGGCGSAIIAGKAIGIFGVSLAFGLTVLTMAYAIGPISGCHLNPAVSIGLSVSGRFSVKDLIPYIVAQVVGAICACGLLYVVLSSHAGPSFLAGVANGYDGHSPEEYSLVACFIMESVLTCMFLLIILGSTDKRSPAGFAPIAIGLGLTLIHLVGIPFTNLSVNPARSTGPALFETGWALSQLWLFWVAPIAGAVVAGVLYRVCFAQNQDTA